MLQILSFQYLACIESIFYCILCFAYTLIHKTLCPSVYWSIRRSVCPCLSAWHVTQRHLFHLKQNDHPLDVFFVALIVVNACLSTNLKWILQQMIKFYLLYTILSKIHFHPYFLFPPSLHVLLSWYLSVFFSFFFPFLLTFLISSFLCFFLSFFLFYFFPCFPLSIFRPFFLSLFLSLFPSFLPFSLSYFLSFFLSYLLFVLSFLSFFLSFCFSSLFVLSFFLLSLQTLSNTPLVLCFFPPPIPSCVTLPSIHFLSSSPYLKLLRWSVYIAN